MRQQKYFVVMGYTRVAAWVSVNIGSGVIFGSWKAIHTKRQYIILTDQVVKQLAKGMIDKVFRNLYLP